VSKESLHLTNNSLGGLWVAVKQHGPDGDIVFFEIVIHDDRLVKHPNG
jgi:hypothetical protein